MGLCKTNRTVMFLQRAHFRSACRQYVSPANEPQVMDFFTLLVIVL